MIVGTLRIRLAVYESYSLKDKRRAIQGVKERMRHRFNVSVAEVDARDARQRAVLGVAVVGTDTAGVHRSLDKLLDWLRRQGRVSLVDMEREVF